MTDRLLLSFDSADALVAAARAMTQEGVPYMDAHTPWRVAELDEALDLPEPNLRPVMLGAGLAGAVAIFGLQAWSAIWFYPINSGGRPLFSWPAFGFPTFETGILAAAFAGFAAMLWKCRLPKLNDPFFATDKTVSYTHLRAHET